MFGKIQFENFEGLTKMPQRAASAWSAVENLVGAEYKPLLYCGKQLAQGWNYYFIAELTFIFKNPERHLVILAVNEFDGEYKLVPDSIQVIL